MIRTLIPVVLAVLNSIPSSAGVTLEVTRTKADIEVGGEFSVGSFINEELQKDSFFDGLGNLDASVNGRFMTPGTMINASATQNEDGTSSLTFDSFTGDGDIEQIYVSNLSTLVHYKIENNGSVAEQVEFDFSISNMTARILRGNMGQNPFTDGFFAPDGEGAAIALRYRIRQDPDLSDSDAPFFDFGGDSLRYGADFEAWTQFEEGAGHKLRTGRVRGWSPTATPIVEFGFTNGHDISIAPETGSLSLGILQPGEMVSVWVGTAIEGYSGDREPFLQATFNDPVGASIRSTAVPEPSSLLFMTLVAAGFAAQRRYLG